MRDLDMDMKCFIFGFSAVCGLLLTYFGGEMLETVVDAITNPSVETGAAGQCAAMGILAFISDNKIKIAEQGGIQLISEAMTNHTSVAVVQAQGCAALWSLALDDDNQIKIAEQGGIQQILDATTNHKSVAGVQEWGCRALGNLAANPDNQIKIAEQGGIQRIIEAMTNHRSVAGVQAPGCGALGNLASNLDNQIKIAEQGGIQTILEAMTNHKSVAGVQAQGCRALRSVAANPDNQIKIAEQGGIQRIIEAMANHTSVAGVQEQCCRALGNLAANPDNQIKIAEQGGIQRIIYAMFIRSEWGDWEVEISEYGYFDALQFLLADPVIGDQLRIKLEGPDQITAFRKLFQISLRPDSLISESRIDNVLNNRSLSSDIIRCLRGNGILIRVATTMEGDEERFLHLMVLPRDRLPYGYVTPDDINQWLVELGIVDHYGTIFHDRLDEKKSELYEFFYPGFHAESDAFKAYAKSKCDGLMEYLKSKKPSIQMINYPSLVALTKRQEFEKLDVGPPRQELEKLDVGHKSVAGVQEWGCRALMNLATNPDNQIKIAKQGGIDRIIDAMTNHRSVAGIQEQCCGALGNLAANPDNQIKIAEQIWWDSGQLSGIQQILEAMTNHKSMAGVQENGCGALGNLVNKNPDNQIKVAEQGGIQLILEAMTNHTSVSGVQEQCCRALMNLGWSNQNLQQQIKTAGAELVVRRALAASNATSTTKEKGQMLLDWLGKV